MAHVIWLYIIPVKRRHLRCANCRHLDSFCCFHSLSALGRHRSEQVLQVRHRKLTCCLKEGSRYRVLGISYQRLNIWSIFLAISQKANTWCLQQARTKPDCALTNLAFRFCAAFMCALLALKAWHAPNRERLQTGSTKHPFNPNTKLPRAALVVAAWARQAQPAAPAHTCNHRPSPINDG